MQDALQEKRLNRQRKGGKDAAPQPEEDAQASDAARIEVLTAQLDAANTKLEEGAKRCNYLLLERVSPAVVRRPATAPSNQQLQQSCGCCMTAGTRCSNLIPVYLCVAILRGDAHARNAIRDKICSQEAPILMPSPASAVLPERTAVALQMQDMVEEYYHIARADLEAAERVGRFKDADLETAEDRHLIEQKVPFQHLVRPSENPRQLQLPTALRLYVCGSCISCVDGKCLRLLLPQTKQAGISGVLLQH